MSDYQRKRDRSEELSQSGLKVILLRLGNFHTYIRNKDVMTSLFAFILSSENWMYFRERKTLSLQSSLTWTVFSYQMQEMTVNGVFHSVILVQGAPCSSLNLFFRRKLRRDFIFGIPYSCIKNFHAHFNAARPSCGSHFVNILCRIERGKIKNWRLFWVNWTKIEDVLFPSNTQKCGELLKN